MPDSPTQDDATRIAEIAEQLEPVDYLPGQILGDAEIAGLWMRDRRSAIYLLALLRARDGEIERLRSACREILAEDCTALYDAYEIARAALAPRQTS